KGNNKCFPPLLVKEIIFNIKSLYFKGTIEREMITMSINQTNSRLNEITTALGSNLDEVISWRRYLHQHAELSFEENETATFLEENLVSFGIEVKTNIGG